MRFPDWVLETKVCAECEQAYHPRQPYQLRCSARCSKKASRERRRLRALGGVPPEALAPETKSCVLCGQMFETAHPSQLYCSPSCSGRAKNRRRSDHFPSVESLCARCGHVFLKRDENARYCSQECKRRQQYADNPKKLQICRKSKSRGRLRNDRILREAKAVGCKTCGEKHPDCIDFHHRDPAIKKGGVAEMARDCVSEDKLRAEIAKCDPLCRNCHAKLEAKIRRKKWGIVHE